MGSSSQTTNSSSSSQPGWAPQVADLTNAFSLANGALSQAQGAQAPTNYTAQFTPDQLATFKSMLGYSNNTNTGNLNTSGNTNVTNGTNATGAALTGLNGFNPSATNNPAALEQAASSFVQGQNIPAEVAQATQQANQTANQVTLPQITQNANIGGNADSSRTGIAQGLVEQGLAENAQNLSGALTSQAYSNGLNLAENQANTNNAQSLSALTNEGSLGNNATNTGTNAVSNGINDQGALYSIGENAGQGEQASNQAQLTNELQQYQAALQDPFAALNEYYGIVGSNNWGQNTTGQSTTESSPSAWSVLGGLLGGAGSLAGGLGKMGVTGSGIMSGLGSLLML